jgi:hypothetical protein
MSSTSSRRRSSQRRRRRLISLSLEAITQTTGIIIARTVAATNAIAMNASTIVTVKTINTTITLIARKSPMRREMR